YKRNPTGNAVAEEDLRYKTTDIRLLCHPNPFTTATTITLFLSSRGRRAEDIELNIFDVGGRHIRTLLSGDLCSGALTWDGRDNEGKEVNAGVYFVKIKDYEPMKVTKLR
ncbi:MAG: hypothetical protein IMY70_01840, partial [Bacteroidetes bacterium]|nr:hypothetical protein [Bacteroidota bacterium]